MGMISQTVQYKRLKFSILRVYGYNYEMSRLDKSTTYFILRRYIFTQTNLANIGLRQIKCRAFDNGNYY